MRMQHFHTKCCMTDSQSVRCKQGGFNMLRLTVSPEDYLMIGENIKIVFLGGSKNHIRIMLDVPKDVNVVRNKVIEKNTTDPSEKEKLPHYYEVPEPPEKYRRKKIAANDSVKNKQNSGK